MKLALLEPHTCVPFLGSKGYGNLSLSFHAVPWAKGSPIPSVKFWVSALDGGSIVVGARLQEAQLHHEIHTLEFRLLQARSKERSTS